MLPPVTEKAQDGSISRGDLRRTTIRSENEAGKAENVPNWELQNSGTEAQYVVAVSSRDYQRLKK
jgi:hypothetical protein